jgi:hypothetical protein
MCRLCGDRVTESSPIYLFVRYANVDNDTMFEADISCGLHIAQYFKKAVFHRDPFVEIY